MEIKDIDKEIRVAADFVKKSTGKPEEDSGERWNFYQLKLIAYYFQTLGYFTGKKSGWQEAKNEFEDLVETEKKNTDRIIKILKKNIRKDKHSSRVENIQYKPGYFLDDSAEDIES